jgi:hypothetical protein
MYPRTLTPKLPKGLAFDIPDHMKASQWAALHGFPLSIELDYGLGNEEYEEVMAFYAGTTSRRLWCVMWRQVDCIVVQPVVGRSNRFLSVADALNSLLPRRR